MPRLCRAGETLDVFLYFFLFWKKIHSHSDDLASPGQPEAHIARLLRLQPGHLLCQQTRDLQSAKMSSSLPTKGRPQSGRPCVHNAHGMSWQSWQTADRLPAGKTDVLAADATDVMAADKYVADGKLAVGCWLLVVGCWLWLVLLLLALGCWMLVVGCRLPVAVGPSRH